MLLARRRILLRDKPPQIMYTKRKPTNQLECAERRAMKQLAQQGIARVQSCLSLTVGHYRGMWQRFGGLQDLLN